MTKHECAVVMAYTGVAMLKGEDFSIFHHYIETKLKRPVQTFELATSEMCYRIKEASKEDFMELCRRAV